MGKVMGFFFLQISRKSQQGEASSSSSAGTIAKVYFSLAIADGGLGGISVVYGRNDSLGKMGSSERSQSLILLVLHMHCLLFVWQCSGRNNLAHLDCRCGCWPPAVSSAYSPENWFHTSSQIIYSLRRQTNQANLLPAHQKVSYFGNNNKGSLDFHNPSDSHLMVARVDVVLVLCGLFRVQHSEQMRAGDADLGVEAALALPHLVQVLDRCLPGALAAADYVPGVQRAWVFLVLQGEAVLELVGDLVHHPRLDDQEQFLEAVVEFQHAELVDKGLVVGPFLEAFFVDDDCLQELLESLHASLYDQIAQDLAHWGFEPFEAVEAEEAPLKVPEAQFSELKLFELAPELLIMLVHPPYSILNILGVVGLQHLLDPPISLLQDLRFFLQLVPFELFPHGGEAVLVAGNQLNIDAVFCLYPLAGRKQQFFAVAEDDFGEVVSFLSVDVRRSYPSAKESLLRDELPPVLCQLLIVGLDQRLEDLIVGLVFLHLHDLVGCEAQAEKRGLQVFGESEDAEDEVTAVGGGEAEAHSVMHHFYLLASLDDVREMPSSMIFEVVLHFGADDSQDFWKVIIPWAFGPLELTGSLVFLAQQGRIAPVSFDEDLVDPLHDFLVFSVFPREVRDELGRVINGFSCLPVDDGGLWDIASLHSCALFLCYLRSRKRRTGDHSALQVLLVSGLHCEAFEEVGTALPSQGRDQTHAICQLTGPMPLTNEEVANGILVLRTETLVVEVDREVVDELGI